MDYEPITAVGIDVSKGKSTVAVRRPGGEVVLAPFRIEHNAQELKELVDTIRKIGGTYGNVLASNRARFATCRIFCKCGQCHFDSSF